MSNSFKEYLLNEHSVISEAHFNTQKTITEFFKHYLVVMALAAGVFSYFYQKEFTSFGNLMTGLVFLGISLIGLSLCLYITNLQFDAILYARTVNGVSIPRQSRGLSKSWAARSGKFKRLSDHHEWWSPMDHFRRSLISNHFVAHLTGLDWQQI